MSRVQFPPRFVLLFFFVFSVFGCVTANFTEPISSFQKSVDQTGAIVSTYFSELNQFERELYLEERAFNNTLDVLAIDERGEKTPLYGKTFSAESIKARTDAITLLGMYATRLAKLAGSDAPARFAASSTLLGENLGKLNETFAELANDNKILDATASAYVGPISNIIGAIGKMHLEETRDKMLAAAIKEGAPKVESTLNLLESDLLMVVGPLQRTGLKQKLAEQVVYYNENRESFSVDQRRKALKEIDQAAARYDSAVTFNPSILIGGMRKANQALLKYSQADKTPENLAELMSALEIFKSRVKEIAPSVKQLYNLRKGTA